MSRGWGGGMALKLVLEAVPTGTQKKEMYTWGPLTSTCISCSCLSPYTPDNPPCSCQLVAVAFCLVSWVKASRNEDIRTEIVFVCGKP